MLCTEKRFIPSMLVVGLVLLILSPLPKVRADGNPDQGWSIDVQTMPLDFAQVNSCNGGDVVSLHGQATLITRVKVQPDGLTSVKSSGSFDACAVTKGDSKNEIYDL